MNNLAMELNSILDNTVTGRLLSRLGRRLYFPNGIIAQSAEAKISAHAANATIGMAFKDGKPLALSAVMENMNGFKPDEVVLYAPTAGIEQVRNIWKASIIEKNTSLENGNISLPAVVPGITAGISYTADLFLDEGQTIMVSDPCWDNYNLIFSERRGAELLSTPFFNSGPGLNMAAIGQAVRNMAKSGVVRMILNFPNNPSGYTPTKAEAEGLISLIREIAEDGADVLVICDDAYFGLYYENDIYRESLFGRLAGLHKRILAVKIDGPTKEEYVWGLRTAFLTFGSHGMDGCHHAALTKKLMGAIRSSVSCSNTSSQYLIMKTLADKRTEQEKTKYRELLEERYQAIKRFVRDMPNHPILTPLPFNSGYFMSFQCKGVNAELLRRELLSKHGIGTIALGEQFLRIAYSGVDLEKIPLMYRIIYKTAESLL
ncbi:MAG: aminotransferase class I/II-fold pyridoxal phosphate-dependent enzyme [Treponema sp.]|jgi:aspartate/methionine/tyrosine aminotransferase|nr:aminotransferase class I/II-fold pyridoxal phosphate-dependent enzyme [Treponema sp.]